MRQITRILLHTALGASLIGTAVGCGTMPPSKPTKPAEEMPEKHMSKDMMDQMQKDQKAPPK